MVKFEIRHNSESLGSITGTHINFNEKDIYAITSDIIKKVLQIKKLTFDLYVEYLNEQLVKSKYEEVKKQVQQEIAK